MSNSNHFFQMDNILKTYQAILRPVIKTVISCDDFGIGKHGIRAVACDNNNLLLQIPYATRMLSWEVNFLGDNLAFAPDFNFGDDFLDDPHYSVLESSVPTLFSWNIEDPKALLNVIKELMTLYTQQQIRTLTNDARLAKVNAEYIELLKLDDGSKSNEIEISINRGIVNFLIAMDVDFSDLPPYSFPLLFTDVMDPGDNVAYLHIVIDPNVSSRRYQTNLELSPQVEFALGGSSKMSIPQLNIDSNMCQYVKQVRNLLKEKVAKVAAHYHKKMEFIQQILSLTNICVLEYDVVKYDQISLLFGEEHDMVEVIISIDDAFPQERPKVKLNSIYTEKNLKPSSINVHSYVYKPDLSTEAMINNIFVKLRDSMYHFH